MCSTNPDYALLTIDAEIGITNETEEHINLAFGSNLPLIIVFTKIDLSPNISELT